MLISEPAMLTLAFGSLLGAAIHPVVALAQNLVSRFVSRGIWPHMVITMGIWALVMIVWVAILNSAFEKFLPFAERRMHIIYLLFGFLLGMFIGGFMARRSSHSSNPNRP